MAKTWLLFTAVTAALLAVTTAQTNALEIRLGAGQTQFAALETASYMSACHALSYDGATAETLATRLVRLPLVQPNGTPNVDPLTGLPYPDAKTLVSYKMDCLKRLVDPNMICSVDSTTPLNTVCTATSPTGTVAVYTMDTLAFTCQGWEYVEKAPCAAGECLTTNVAYSAKVCPLDNADFKLAAHYAGETAAVAGKCPTDYAVTGYEHCEAKAVCAYASADAISETSNLVSFGDFCPGQSDGTMCCGPKADLVQGADGAYAVNYNTIDLYNSGEGLKPEISHVVDLDIQITYKIENPARLQATITVPYVTSDSNISISSAQGDYVYRMCPSTYFIDMKDPLEGKPPDTTIVLPAVRGSAYPSTNWLPLQYLPKQDAFGRARSTCSSYDFSVDAADTETGQPLLDYLSYPTNANSKFYGDVPVYDAAAWPEVVLDTTPGSLLGALTPGQADTPFWTKSAPFGDLYDKKITYETGNWDIVRGWRGCKGKNQDENLVTTNPEQESHVVNGVAYPVTTYSWTWYICQVGRYGTGPECGSEDSVLTYAKACAKRPASFSLSPQQISDVVVAPLNAATTAKVFLQSVVGSLNGNTGCIVGSERYVITLNLVYFEAATDSSIQHAEAVHDLVSPAAMFSAGAQIDQTITSVPDVNINNVEDFLTYRRTFGSDNMGVKEGFYLLQEEDNTQGADAYRYQKLIIVTKCYDTQLDPVRGTRGKPNQFVDLNRQASATDLDTGILLEAQLIAANTDNTKRTSLNLRILASEESFLLASAEAMTSQDIQADQAIYGSYSQARTSLGVFQPDGVTPNGVTFTDSAPLRPGAQLCSKHQIQNSHAAVAHLTVNSVGSCLVNPGMTADEQTWAGRTIQYLGAGMRTVQRYTFGCFDDWIDLTAAGVLTPVCSVVDGVYRAAGDAGLLLPGCDPTYIDAVGTTAGRVYYFPDQVKRVSDRTASGTVMNVALVGSYWFVTQGELNTRNVPGSNPTQALSELFGTGVFKYDTDIVDPTQRYTYGVAGSMQLSKSDRDSVTLAGQAYAKAQALTPGCDDNVGNLKSACNLVCFDVVRGLLSPGVGLAKLLIHHISVAEFANTTEAVGANTYVSARRRLLETVTPFGGLPALGESTMPSGIQSITVEADPRDAITAPQSSTTEAAATTAADAANSTGATAATAATGNVDVVTDDDNDVNVVWMITTYVLLGLIIVFAIVYGIWYCSYGHTGKSGLLGGHSAYGHDDSRTEDLLHHPSQGAYRRSSKY